MALVDGDGVARLLLPVVGKELVVLLVELAGGVVAHIEQVQIGSAGGYHSRKRHGRNQRAIGE
jgi:hypothetical protein